jgi:hypothetical protein
LTPPHPIVSTASAGAGTGVLVISAGSAIIRLTTTERTWSRRIASDELDV